MLTSLTSSCLWSSDVPWESWLVFLDRHASISQAKGTVNLPWKRAPLSKLLQPRQSVLCLHFPFNASAPHFGNSVIHVVWSCQTPPDCCHPDLHVPPSSYQQLHRLSPCSPVLDTICMLTSPWKRRWFLRRSGRCKFMNGKPCPPSPQQPSFLSCDELALSHSPERKHPLFRSNAVVSSKHHIKKKRNGKKTILCKMLK